MGSGILPQYQYKIPEEYPLLLQIIGVEEHWSFQIGIIKEYR